MAEIEVVEGDITKLELDAITNAANTDLRHGGGVAGAISRAGGPSIQAESDGLAPIDLGAAVATGGGDLPARWVIHAATMHLGGPTSAEAIRAATASALRVADELGARSLASWPSAPASAGSRSTTRRGSRPRRSGAISGRDGTRASRLLRVRRAGAGGVRARRGRVRLARDGLGDRSAFDQPHVAGEGLGVDQAERLLAVSASVAIQASPVGPARTSSGAERSPGRSSISSTASAAT